MIQLTENAQKAIKAIKETELGKFSAKALSEKCGYKVIRGIDFNCKAIETYNYNRETGNFIYVGKERYAYKDSSSEELPF